MAKTLFIPQTKLDVLYGRVCRPIQYLGTRFNQSVPLWLEPIAMCENIEKDVFSVESVIIDAKRYNGFFNGPKTPRMYHALLCRVYILLYYRHRDAKEYQEIVFPRLQENMGVYYEDYLKCINGEIDKILALEELVKDVQEEKKKDVKPIFAYVPHNRNELDSLYIEYGEELLFRNMVDVIKVLSEDYATHQDEADVWFNAKEVVHTFRDLKRPEMFIERAAIALVKGQLYNGYEGAQIILLCAYVMIRLAKDDLHFIKFIQKMESYVSEYTDMEVIRDNIGRIRKWIFETPNICDSYDYVGGESSTTETFTSTDIERLRSQIMEKEKEEREKLLHQIEKLESRNDTLKKQIEFLTEELKAEKAKKKAEPAEDEQEVEMLDVESIPVLKLLWYLMQLDGANVQGHGKKKPVQNLLSTLSKIPYDTTKHLWSKEDKPNSRQEDLLVKMNLWMKSIGMKFQF